MADGSDPISNSLAGIQAAITGITTAAHNVANVSTPGFKALIAQQSSGGGTVTASVTARSPAQGTIELTGRALDLAISGEGYFQVQRPDGSLAFTRAGQFGLDAS